MDSKLWIKPGVEVRWGEKKGVVAHKYCGYQWLVCCDEANKYYVVNADKLQPASDMSFTHDGDSYYYCSGKKMWYRCDPELRDGIVGVLVNPKGTFAQGEYVHRAGDSKLHKVNKLEAVMDQPKEQDLARNRCGEISTEHFEQLERAVFPPPTWVQRTARKVGKAAWKYALWPATWPVRYTSRKTLEGFVTSVKIAMFGGLCYGGYQVYQFLSNVQVTW